MAGLTITNPLSLNGGSFTIGSTSTPKGYSNTGTLLSGIPNTTTSSGSGGSTSLPLSAPAPTPPSSSTGTNGGSTSGSTYTDPYAGTVFGSTAGYNQAVSDYNNLKGSTLNSIGEAVTAGGQGYDYSLLHYLNGRTADQNQIDSDSVQNELAREQGSQSILDMVGNGIRSSGVTLANRNAGSSSAAEAIARAYGIEGRQEMSKVGNQFAQGQNKVNTEESNLALRDSDEKLSADYDKTNTINSIINSARSQLAALNQSAAYAKLPDRVDIEAKIAEVKQQALDALSAYDSVLTKGIAAGTPMAADAVRAKANSLLTAGTAPEQPFDYSTNIPTEFQGTGQFASSLPIFLPKRQTT